MHGIKMAMLLAFCSALAACGAGPPAPAGEGASAPPAQAQAAPAPQTSGSDASQMSKRPNPPSPEPAGPSLGWRTAVDHDAIAVEFSDPTSHYRVEKVELLGPGGERIPSGPLTRTVERSYGYDTQYPSSGFSIFGGTSTGVGVGIGIGTPPPLGSTTWDSAPHTRTQTRIPLPDPAAYKSAYRNWKIAVQLSDTAGEPVFVEIPAPQP